MTNVKATNGTVLCRQVKKKKQLINKLLIAFCIAVYSLILIWIVIFKCGDTKSLHISANLARPLADRLLKNIIPFRSVYYAIINFNTSREFTVFLLNFVIFTPLGVLLPYFFKKKTSLLILLAFTLGVEVFQLFSGWGGFDTTDIIMNFFGGYYGVSLYENFFKGVSGGVINKIAKITFILGLIICIFTILHTVTNFPTA